MIPLLHPPFSPYSTPIVHEEVKGTASVMEPAKPEVPKKYSVNRHSKKRKAEEAYMKKKTGDSSENGIVQKTDHSNCGMCGALCTYV